MKKLKTAIVLILPLLLFFVLYMPYGYLNGHVLVDWLGCGCNFNSFNANDFTNCFWAVIALATTGLSVVLSKKIPKDKMWLRIVYIVIMFIVSLVIAYNFSRSMMWD